MEPRIGAASLEKLAVFGEELQAKKTTALESLQHAVTDVVEGAWHWQGKRMSKVDTAWLSMDSDANLMMIVGVLVLKPSICVATL